MGIIAAMEEIQEETLGAENLEQAADQAAVVGEDRVEVAEAGAEIASDVAEVESASEDVAELAEIGEVAEAQIESGEGLSEQAAEVATIAIERIHNRLGFRGQQRIVPATESFGQANTRLASTKLVVESISETIKSVWEAIKAMAKRIWDKIVMFFKKIFGSAKALRDHLENLKKRAQNLPGEAKMKEKELTGALCKKISVKKKADLASYEVIVKNSLDLAGAAGKISAESASIASDVSGLTAALQSSGVTEANVKTFASAMDNSFNKVKGVVGAIATVAATGVGVKSKSKVAKNGDITFTETYGPFANGQVIVAQGSKRNFKVGATTVPYSTIALSFDSLDSKEVAEKAKALNKAEIAQVLDLATKACAAAEDMEKNQKEIQKIVDESQKSADNVLKAAGKVVEAAGKSDDRVAMNEAREAITTVFGLVNQLGQRIPAALINAAYAGADYASASIANHR